MNIQPAVWDLKRLIANKDIINPKPQYQRTSVWQQSKKKLLIDSILRGYDIPKFYIRSTPNDPLFQFEVTDGQQRMRTIWEFSAGSFHLDDGLIGALNTKGLTYDELKKHPEIFKKFEDFKVQIATIEEATQEEIRTLFARLQMGERLNPVELRHAIASNIGNAINSTVENHNFFDKDCKIPNNRYKHQDYLDNAITLSYYDGLRNIKAVDMRFLYQEKANSLLNEMQPLMQKVSNVLDIIRKVNGFKKGIFKNKWAFVDIFYLVYKNLDFITDVKAKAFADNFFIFESLRKQNNNSPETLIDDKTSLHYDKDLYDYIIAFKTSGAEKNNAKIRYRVLYNKFFNSNNFIIK